MKTRHLLPLALVLLVLLLLPQLAPARTVTPFDFAWRQHMANASAPCPPNAFPKNLTGAPSRTDCQLAAPAMLLPLVATLIPEHNLITDPGE